jgi:hypothetical protein
LPEQIRDNGGQARYLNIWSNVLFATNVFAFPVVVIRGTGGEYVTTGTALTPTAAARVIIYDNKYTNQPLNNSNVQPHYRAFVVNGVPKITGGLIPSADTDWYQGSNPSSVIPCLDESEWIDYANGGSPPSVLANNYAALSSGSKMTQLEWDGLALAPAPLGIKLAVGANAPMYAVVPNILRKREREA